MQSSNIIYSVCWCFVLVFVGEMKCGVPSDMKIPSRKAQNAVTQQNIQNVLQSIDERLGKLDGLYKNQVFPSVEVKLEQFSRKIDNLEGKLSRLETIMHMEMDKMSENISSKNFKDDIVKDHLLRKIDSVYDRINHRLVYVELQMEMNEKKLQDKIELVLSRQQKLEETLIVRDSDMQLDINDAIAAMDETKLSCGVAEEQIQNFTKFMNSTSTKALDSVKFTLKEQIAKLHENMTSKLNNLENNFFYHLEDLNKTVQMSIETKDAFQEMLADYGNKLWEKNEQIQNTAVEISQVQNSTRTELQNSLRAVMVQIGKNSKKPREVEEDTELSKLGDMYQTMESNFQTLKDQQNMFIESCHRVQMDESQLESKISSVLERLIEILEERTKTEKKDIKSLENLIKSHDGNLRRINYQLSNSLITLMDKTEDNRKRAESTIRSIQSQLNDIVVLLQDKSDSGQENEVILKLQHITSSLSDLNYKLNLYKPTNTTNAILKEVQHMKNFIKNMNRNITDQHKNLEVENQLIYSSMEVLLQLINSTNVHDENRQNTNEKIINGQITKGQTPISKSPLLNPLSIKTEEMESHNSAYKQSKMNLSMLSEEEIFKLIDEIYGPPPKLEQDTNLQNSNTEDANFFNQEIDCGLDGPVYNLDVRFSNKNNNLTDNKQKLEALNRRFNCSTTSQRKPLDIDVRFNGNSENATDINLEVQSDEALQDLNRQNLTNASDVLNGHNLSNENYEVENNFDEFESDDFDEGANIRASTVRDVEVETQRSVQERMEDDGEEDFNENMSNAEELTNNQETISNKKTANEISEETSNL